MPFAKFPVHCNQKSQCGLIITFKLLCFSHVAVANGPFLSMSGTGHHQQRVNEWPEALLSEYHLLLKRISDSLDLEQVKGLCYVSVEAEKAGICNRNDFSGIVLLDFFDKMMLITPSNLIYLARMLLLLIGWTCAVSLTSTMVGC